MTLVDVARLLVGRVESTFGATVCVRRVLKGCDLFDWSDLDRIVTRTAAPRNLLLDGHRWTSPSTSDVLAQLPRGATLQVQDIDLVDERIGSVCAEIGLMLGGCRVGCNAYVSPSSRHGGLRPHRDVVDAAIVQVSGRKDWRVFEPTAADPAVLDDETFLDLGDAQPSLTAVLSPGDVLWVRRGDPHVAQAAGAEPSLHLTFGAYRPSGYELAQWLLGEASVRQQLREPAPWRGGPQVRRPGGSRGDDAWVGETISRLIDRLGGLDVDDVTAAFRDAEAIRPRTERFLEAADGRTTNLRWLSVDGVPTVVAGTRSLFDGLRVSGGWAHPDGAFVALDGTASEAASELVRAGTMGMSVESLVAILSVDAIRARGAVRSLLLAGLATEGREHPLP